MREDITVVNFGPGEWDKLTIEVRDILLSAERIIMRDSFTWEVARKLERWGKRLITLSSLFFRSSRSTHLPSTG